jgi:hypothetical protein
VRYQLRLSSLSVGFFDLNNFPSVSAGGRRIKIGQALRKPEVRCQTTDGSWEKQERKVRSTDAIAASVSNFTGGSAEIRRFTFLTESLILAQNERWRRG